MTETEGEARSSRRRLRDKQSIDLTDRLGEGDRVILRGGERLVRVGGNLGVFRALELSADDEDLEVLRRKVRLLGRELTALEEERAKLESQLAQARRPTPPADFSTAVSSALDDLSHHLTGLKNTTSDFAVREFSLQAQVTVDVDDEERLVYRFPMPEDEVDPRQLSTVTVRIVPLAKDDTEATDGDRATAPPAATGLASASIAAIHGLGETSRRRLEAHGIATVADLVSVATRARTALQLQGLLGSQRRHLVGWLAQAELLTLPEMTGRMASVLIEAGIDSLRTLVDTEPAAIVTSYAAAASRLEAGLGPSEPIDEPLVGRWQQVAARSPLLATGALEV